MKEEEIKEILEHFEKKPSLRVVWLSGICDQISLPEIRELWGYKSRQISQQVYRTEESKDDRNYLQLLQDLNIISVEEGAKNKKLIESKTGWLGDLYFSDIGKERLQNPGEEVFVQKEKKEIRKFFESEAFISAFKPGYIINQIAIRNSSKRHFTAMLSRSSSSMETVEHEAWKEDFDWLEIIETRLEVVRFCKGVKEVGKPAEAILEKDISILHESYRLGIRKGVDVFSSYDKLEDIEIPDILKPLFTEEEVIERYVEQLSIIKENWGSAWEEIMERVEK